MSDWWNKPGPGNIDLLRQVGGLNRVPGLYEPPQLIPKSTPAPSTALSPPLPGAPPAIEPAEFAAILYGKDIPVAIGSRFQVGGRIIEGPIEGAVDGERIISMMIGYYIPVNYWDHTRTITELWFRGKLAWSLSGGAYLPNLNVGGATAGTEQRVRFTTGTLDQAADAWSIARNGAASAIAYIPLVTGIFENIKTGQFGDLIPFTSVTVEDTAYGDPDDQVPWSDILEALARYDGRPADEFEAVDVTRGVEALILGQKIYFPELLAGLRRVKPYWHIRTADKLYVVEKGPYSLDLTVELPKIVARGPDPITFHLSDQSDRNREVLLNYLDVDRDYEPNVARAVMDRDPVQITDAYKTDNVNVPVVSTADEMIVDANLALYSEEMARETSEMTGTASYLGLEPGDTLLIPTDERNFHHVVTEVVRRVDHTVEVKAEAFLTCAIEADELTGDTVFVTGDQCCFLVSTTLEEPTTEQTWTELGSLSWGDGGHQNASSYAMIGGTPTFLMGGSDGIIMASNDGVSWHDVFNGELTIEEILDRGGSADVLGIAWDAVEQAFFACIYCMFFSPTERQDRLYRSSDGETWTLEDTATTGAGSGHTVGLLVDHIVDRGVIDSRGNPVPDGVYGYDTENGIIIAPATPPVIFYDTGGVNFLAANNNVTVTIEGGGTSTVAVTGIAQVFCVAFAGGIWQAVGSTASSTGIIATSIDDGATWTTVYDEDGFKISTIVGRNMTVDPSDPVSVQWLQNALLQVIPGYMWAEANGNYDALTQKAVRQYQKQNQLLVSGNPDAETVAKIEQDLERLAKAP